MKMMKTYQYYLGLVGLATAMMFASCSDDQNQTSEEGLLPIVFSSVASDHNVASTRASQTLGHDFVVYGYKRVADGEQLVFNGYTVKYLAESANTTADNTDNYYYVHGDQTLKFWDLSASEYHFWGYWAETPGLATISGAQKNVLTIPGVTLRTGEPAPADNVLFSSLLDRNPVGSGVVRLEFQRPYSKVRIQFYTNDEMGVSDVVNISTITFSPDPAATSPLVSKIYGQGDVKITYPLTAAACDGTARESVVLANLSNPQSDLPFENVQLTHTQGVSSNTAVSAEVSTGKYYYYPLPMGDRNPTFVMHAFIDGVEKTALVPAMYMQWKPNHEYTYVFKVSREKITFSFVLDAIMPWQAGVSGDTTW